MGRFWLVAGALNGFLAVALGAFAAHGLRTRLEQRMFEVFEVGVRYHMYHALAMLAVAWLVLRNPLPATTPWSSPALASAAGWCFLAGVVIFSGSLYVLAITGVRQLGMITPFGGLAFLIGWLLLAIAGLRMAS